MNEQDEIHRATNLHDPEQLLLALQQGRLSNGAIVMALKRFGETRFMEARIHVEQLLTNAQPTIRAAALQTLLTQWKLPEYTRIAHAFLLDPEPECREQAIESLQEEQANTINMRTLSLLAQIANNRYERDVIRLKAYSTLLAIAGLSLNTRRQREWGLLLESGQRFEDIPWIDWGLIAFLCERWPEQAEQTCVLLSAVSRPYPWHRATALSKDGRLLTCVSTSDDRGSFAIEVWNLSQHRYRLLRADRALREESDLQSEESYEDDGREPMDLACWSSDGTHLAVAWREGILDIWQVAWEQEQECRHMLSYQTGEGFQALAWGNRSPCIAAATGSEVLYWENPEGAAPERKAYPSQDAEYPLPGYGRIEALAFSPDDTLLLTGDSEGKLFQWSLKRYLFSFPPSNWWRTKSHMPIARLSWSPDGTRVAVHSVASNESDGIIGQATSIIYLRQDHIFSFGEGGFSDILGWSPDGTQLVGLRHDEILTHVHVELFDAFTGQCVASYNVSKQILPASSLDHFTSFDAVLSPDGRSISWCAKSYHWRLDEPATAPQEPIWYGNLSLPLVQREASSMSRHLEILLQQTPDRLGWQQGKFPPMGDAELVERVLAPRLRILRTALKQDEMIILSFHVHAVPFTMRKDI